MNAVLGAYRPGRTPLHLVPAWGKIALLFAWAITTVAIRDWRVATALAAVALVALVSTKPGWRVTVRGMATITVIAALTSVYHVWNGDYGRAGDLAADLMGIFALALAITVSTPMSEMLDLATAAARPLRRVIPPVLIGLMFSIMLRTIPEISRILAQSREAAKARGVERSVRALMIPTATRTVGFALDLGAAMHARGVGDEAGTWAPATGGPPPADLAPASRKTRRAR